MKKGMIVSLFLGGFLLLFGGAAIAQDDVQKHASCKHCGMDRVKFSHSRMLIEFEDGTTEGVCSLHCAALELGINLSKTPRAIRVGDYYAKKLIDSEKAFWIIGGSKPGVMTKRAKWAFERKEDALRFAGESGGELASFDQALKAAYEDIYEDAKMIREKRKAAKTMGSMGHQHP